MTGQRQCDTCGKSRLSVEYLSWDATTCPYCIVDQLRKDLAKAQERVRELESEVKTLYENSYSLEFTRNKQRAETLEAENKILREGLERIPGEISMYCDCCYDIKEIVEHTLKETNNERT